MASILETLGGLTKSAASGTAAGALGALPGALSFGARAIKSGIGALEPLTTKKPVQEDVDSGISSWFGKAQRFLDITPERKAEEHSLVNKTLDTIANIADKASPESLLEAANEYTSDFFKPKDKYEEITQNVFKDAGSIIGFGGPAKTALKMSVFGNTAYEGAKAAGLKEGSAELAKVAGMLVSPAFNKSMIPGMRKDLYKKASDAVKTVPDVSFPGLQQAARDVIKESSVGGSVSWQNDTKRFAKSLLGKSKYDRISPKELWAFKKQLNDKISRGVFADKKRFLLEPMEKAIRSNLKAYGMKNKAFGDAFKNADTLFGIEKGLPFLDKFMNKKLGIRDSGLGEYFRKALVYGHSGIKGLVAKSVLGSVSRGVESYLKSPVFREASNKLALGVAKGSFPVAAKAMEELEQVRKRNTDWIAGEKGQRFKLVDAPQNRGDKMVSPAKKVGTFEVVSKEELAKMRGA